MASTRSTCPPETGKILHAGTAETTERKIGVYELDTGNWMLDVESDLPTGKSHQQMYLTPQSLLMLMTVLIVMYSEIKGMIDIQDTLDNPDIQYHFSRGILDGLDNRDPV